MGYLSGFLMTLFLGFFQFGYQQGNWNVIQVPYKNHYKWDPDQTNFYDSIVTTVYSVGAMIGALGSGVFFKYGKWNVIMACNMIALVGTLLTTVAGIYFVIGGRFLLGLAIGGYNVYVPKFLNEISPVEYRGPVGGIN